MVKKGDSSWMRPYTKFKLTIDCQPGPIPGAARYRYQIGESTPTGYVYETPAQAQGAACTAVIGREPRADALKTSLLKQVVEVELLEKDDFDPKEVKEKP